MANFVHSGSVRGAAHTNALATRSKEEWFEAKTLHVALESDKSLLLKVELLTYTNCHIMHLEAAQISFKV
jgi:hypothetical protein